jgi:hypothetical protein
MKSKEFTEKVDLRAFIEALFLNSGEIVLDLEYISFLII